MGGMGGPLQTNIPLIVSAFESALLRRSLIVLGIIAVLAVVWYFTREARLSWAGNGSASGAVLDDEPTARKALRIGFGLLWLLDGFLQMQPAMPIGMPGNVITPAAASSPLWVQHLVNVGVTIWNNHPIAAATSAVWIELGIGAWLLVAPRGRWSRAGGLASAGWAIVVWVFGEAFGGIFAPGGSFLFGLPGAVLIYFVAGALVALPERVWAARNFGRALLAGMGVYLCAMAALQAWPGRGFWQGRATAHAATGPVDAMAKQMSTTPQPGLFSRLVTDFGAFDASHGFAVNLVVVIALGLVGVAFISGLRRLLGPALIVLAVFCVATWVFVQDLGFFGGTGTDPNSAIPTLLFATGCFLAAVRVPARVESLAVSGDSTKWIERLSPTYVLRALATFGALGVVLLGAAPMALASTNPVADAVVAQAIGGSPSAVNEIAPNFRLFDQFGRPFTLSSLRGRAVVLTFLDPVCTVDCPLIAQELRQADSMLGSNARNTEFVAIVANPIFHSVSALDAFDRQESLNGLGNWRYLTGSVAQLKSVWNAYGIQTLVEPGGAMVAHTDLLYVIDPQGRSRYVLDSDPGPGTSATRSSFAAEVTGEVRLLLAAK